MLCGAQVLSPDWSGLVPAERHLFHFSLSACSQVHLGGSRGWSVVILPAVGTGVVLYLYCRLTGQSILDFFYVSRSSLANFRNTVQVGTVGRKQHKPNRSEVMLPGLRLPAVMVAQGSAQMLHFLGRGVVVD